MNGGVCRQNYTMNEKNAIRIELRLDNVEGMSPKKVFYINEALSCKCRQNIGGYNLKSYCSNINNCHC